MLLEKVEKENKRIDNIGFILYFKGGNMPLFEVEFYETANGKQPARDFLLSLDKKMRAKMLSMIAILAENGTELREPYSKYISDGIFELRAKVSSNIARVLYFFWSGRLIILANGFIKKTQKIPSEELERAKRYRADYFKRRI